MDDILHLKAKLLGSFLLFTRTLFEARTGREFVISKPDGRESHYITIARELVNVFNLQEKRLLINVPPGHGKSELMKHFIAWSLAHYPDCAFLYISHSHSLAAKHTYGIKKIIQLKEYRTLFPNVEIKHDSSAKDNFSTTAGGVVMAFGGAGAITGQDGGLPNLDRFSGGVFIDDIHKPDEVHSDVIRNNVKNNYKETIEPRARGTNVPIVFLGQRLHEDDLPANLIESFDGRKWKTVILKAIDDNGNVLAPNLITKEELLLKSKFSDYTFHSQYQQNPTPAGGSLFKRDYFEVLNEEPKMLTTFITADTAETEKTYNNATVFSFWGLYKIKENNEETNAYGLHWIDCLEDWMEPKDLKEAFLDFYTSCLRYPVKPKFAAIEKKSTGVTLVSVLKELRGINVIEIERNRGSGSKADRFIAAQDYIAKRLISLPAYAKHTSKCIEHMAKITANNSHRYDDIADTCADAVKIAFIDKIILNIATKNTQTSAVTEKMAAHFNRQSQLRTSLWQQSPKNTRTNFRT